jgi:hypothetical protein
MYNVLGIFRFVSRNPLCRVVGFSRQKTSIFWTYNFKLKTLARRESQNDDCKSTRVKPVIASKTRIILYVKQAGNKLDAPLGKQRQSYLHTCSKNSRRYDISYIISLDLIGLDLTGDNLVAYRWVSSACFRIIRESFSSRFLNSL